ncbi:hypothetical protein H6P81_007634 [Aristolochia fimbriata]|uniref:Uncharacterized protein n=1 Tax=Aristolochia fimbriata TaxID=158543 RepID=A0AAV7F0S7_ARIFI|nr:hypothetical protein H6P81_007634 [Aristolochia fimbriata]
MTEEEDPAEVILTNGVFKQMDEVGREEERPEASGDGRKERISRKKQEVSYSRRIPSQIQSNTELVFFSSEEISCQFATTHLRVEYI